MRTTTACAGYRRKMRNSETPSCLRRGARECDGVGGLDSGGEGAGLLDHSDLRASRALLELFDHLSAMGHNPAGAPPHTHQPPNQQSANDHNRCDGNG